MATAAVERGTAVYVYGVVPAGSAPAEPRLRVIHGGDVAALVADVPVDAFTEDRLADPVWLEAAARAHDEVLGSALAAGPVIPLRLGTLYRSDEQVQAFLEGRRDGLARLLAGLHGTVEVGVKAWFDRSAYVTAQAGAEDTAASGRDYMLRRRREQEAGRRADDVRAECAQASHELLATAARAACANPPQPRELTGRQEEMILNGAYLVGRDEAALAAAVRSLGRRYRDVGVTYEVTGPWPPYNFVEDTA